jgi:ligand-binding sensor domain-containing protein/two-component sensor histidine kinase
MPAIKKYTFVLLLLLISINTIAQSYQITPFTENNGLSSYNVHDITQDNFGFTWISTQDGLNKYDGCEFTIYNKTSLVPFCGNDFTSSYFDSSQNMLWVTSSNGGVDALDVVSNKIIYSLSIDSIRVFLTDPGVKRICRLENGTFIFGTTSGLVILKDFNKTSKTINLNYLKNDYQAAGIFEINKKIYQVTFSNKILIYNKSFQLEKEFDYNNLFQSTVIYTTSIDEYTKNILIFSEKGTYVFNIKDNLLTKLSLPTQIGIPKYIKNKNATTCIIASNTGIFESNNSYTTFSKINFIENSSYKNWELDVNKIFIDKSNQIWYAAKKGVFIQSLKISPFNSFYADNKNKTNLSHLYNLNFINSETVIGSNLKGLYKINITKNEIKLLEPNYSYYSTFRINDNKYFVAREDGLYTTTNFNDFNIVKAGTTYKELKPIENFKFSTYLPLNDSLTALGTDEDKSVFIWNTINHSIYNVNNFAQKLESYYTNGLVKIDANNFLLVTDAEAAIFNTQKRSITKIPINDNYEKRASMFLDAAKINNEYWIASYGSGIFILDSNFKQTRYLNSQNGLSNNGIYKMILDKDGYVWVTTNFGLNRINSKTLNTKIFYLKDGLHNNSFEEYSANILNNKIIAGGPNGFTLINPALIGNKEKPKECIFNNALLTIGKESNEINLLDKKILEIPNTISKVDINIVSINYDLTSPPTYLYNIKELGNNWINLGNKNEIQLIGLTHGTYHLQIKAANEDGIECEPKELTLVFLPKWYQTLWFKALIALSLIAIGFALYKMRVAQIIKEQKIKNALASDLHDELGSSLTGLKVYAYQAKKNPEYMESLQEGITQSIKQVREMIWQLNEEKLTVHDLINKLAIIYKPLLKINNMELAIDVTTAVSQVELNGKEKSHLYLILKEIINNAMKYSQASELSIQVQKGKNRLQFTIADNGIGMQNDNKGYGLKNIEQRAKEIKYNVVTTSSNDGTKYIIEK